MDENYIIEDRLDEIIARIAYAFQGAAPYPWLEDQPIKKLISLNRELNKIDREIRKEK